MFNRIEIWILYLSSLILILFSVLLLNIYFVEKNFPNRMPEFLKPLSMTVVILAETPTKLAREVLNPPNETSSNMPLKYRDIIDDQGYYFSHSNEAMVLLPKFSGERYSGTVELIDLNEKRIIGIFDPNIDEINANYVNDDKFSTLSQDRSDRRAKLYHPLITDDDSIVFNLMGSPLYSMSACYDINWINEKYHFHHSIETDHTGNLWVPGNPLGGTEENYILNIDKDTGKILFEKSLREIFDENNISYLVNNVGDSYNTDPFHLNDIQPANLESNYWNRSDVFLSLRNLSIIILYDTRRGKIKRLIRGPFSYQHDVDIINDEEIIIFNNASRYTKDGLLTEASNIIKYNFNSNKFSIESEALTTAMKLRTNTEGLQEKVNNLMMLEDSNHGRLFVFDGEKVLFISENKFDDKNYLISWARLLTKDEEIIKARGFAKSIENCSE